MVFLSPKIFKKYFVKNPILIFSGSKKINFDLIFFQDPYNSQPCHLSEETLLINKLLVQLKIPLGFPQDSPQILWKIPLEFPQDSPRIP